MLDTSTKILLVAGMFNLLVGGLSGIPMAKVRMDGAAVVPKYLTMVHLGGLMQGPILISIGFAVSISTMSPWVATTGAAILAVASLILIAKDTLNWRQGITDEFAQKSTGLKLGQLFGPLELVGLLFASAAVLSGL